MVPFESSDPVLTQEADQQLQEGQRFGLAPTARPVFIGKGMFVGLLLGIPIGIGAFQIEGLLQIPVALVAAGIALIGPLLGNRLWASWEYAITSDDLELSRGVINHHCTYIPFHRIQQVDIERGPIDRVLGLAKVVLRTAAATTDALIPALPVDEAEHLRRWVLARADLDDAV